MNKELFDSMQKQMTPSPQVRAALTEQLAQPVKKRPVPWMKYGAVAACAALVIGVYAVYQAGKPEGKAALHSYVTVDDLTGFVLENATTATGGSEGGDQDMGMTPEDLTAAMLDVGYTQEEIDEYQAIGYQMTWAKWWKFVDGQKKQRGGRTLQPGLPESILPEGAVCPHRSPPCPQHRRPARRGLYR